MPRFSPQSSGARIAGLALIGRSSFWTSLSGGTLKKPSTPPPPASLGFGISRRPRDSTDPGTDTEPTAARKAKILVVDQDPALRRLMVTRLGGANYAVETVDGAQAGLDACVGYRPDLVMTEFRMKDKDGPSFLQELRNRRPPVPVLEHTPERALSEGRQGHPNQ